MNQKVLFTVCDLRFAAGREDSVRRAGFFRRAVQRPVLPPYGHDGGNPRKTDRGPFSLRQTGLSPAACVTHGQRLAGK